MNESNISLKCNISDLFAIYVERYSHMYPSIYGVKPNKAMVDLISKDFDLKNIVIGNEDRWDEEELESVPLFDNSVESKLYVHPSRRIIAKIGKAWLSVYFHIDELEYVKKIRCLEDVTPSVSGAKISLLCTTGHGFYLKESSLPLDNFNVEKSYGEKFLPFYNNITSKLNENQTGVILLHGVPGSGKTSFIKHLTTVVGRKFVMIPNYMIEQLSSPTLIPFMKVR